MRLLKEAFPRSRVTVVVGHEAPSVRRALPACVRVVVNHDYEATNVSESLRLALERTAPERSALIVYGDLAFNRQALAGLRPDRSSVVLGPAEGRESEVGLTVDGGAVENFCYGLPVKWAHIAMLAPPEKKLFLEAASGEARARLFGFEILNHVIDAGGRIEALRPPGIRLIEVDCSADVEAVRNAGW